jgi:hypothetical protein
MSFTFFVLFSAFFTVQNVAILVLQQDGLDYLGPATLSTLYLTIGVCSFFSSALLNRLGSYKCFIIGGLAQFIFVVSQFFPAYT